MCACTSTYVHVYMHALCMHFRPFVNDALKRASIRVAVCVLKTEYINIYYESPLI